MRILHGLERIRRNQIGQALIIGTEGHKQRRALQNCFETHLKTVFGQYMDCKGYFVDEEYPSFQSLHIGIHLQRSKLENGSIFATIRESFERWTPESKLRVEYALPATPAEEGYQTTHIVTTQIATTHIATTHIVEAVENLRKVSNVQD
ncbi:unnamed protein product, partial [Notodromas monacha]